MVFRLSSLKTIAHYFLLYLLLALNGAMIFVQNRNILLYFVIVLYLVLCLLHNDSGKYNKKEPLYLVTFLLAAVLFVRIVSGGIGIDSWLLYSGQILIVYLCCFFDRELFLDRFVKLTVVMAVISIMCWIIQLVDKPLLLSILKAENSIALDDGRVFTYKGQLLYTLPLHYEALRNTGFFSEPGRYQAVLHGALFCCLFFRDQIKASNKRIELFVTVLIITILSTQSTTGYIGLCIILVGYLIKRPESIKQIADTKLKRRIISLVSIVFFALLIDYNRNGSESIIGRILLEKIADTDISVEASSGGARLRMLSIAWQYIITKPWGAGTFNITGNTAAGGLIRFIAVIGIIPSMVVFIWMLRPLFKEKNRMVEMIVYVAVYINIGIGQSYIFYPALLVVPLAIKYCSDINSGTCI